jgi:hypothetical protein
MQAAVLAGGPHSDTATRLAKHFLAHNHKVQLLVNTRGQLYVVPILTRASVLSSAVLMEFTSLASTHT